MYVGMFITVFVVQLWQGWNGSKGRQFINHIGVCDSDATTWALWWLFWSKPAQSQSRCSTAMNFKMFHLSISKERSIMTSRNDEQKQWIAPCIPGFTIATHHDTGLVNRCYSLFSMTLVIFKRPRIKTFHAHSAVRRWAALPNLADVEITPTK